MYLVIGIPPLNAGAENTIFALQYPVATALVILGAPGIALGVALLLAELAGPSPK
jgi:hypothetical protein